MKKLYFWLSVTCMLLLSISQINAQVNGPAVDPIVSTAENPVWYFIESASDGSDSFNNFTGDFRGNVMISPTSPAKIMHNTLSTATTTDHAKWQLVSISGNVYLKNKGTGMFMTGSHSVGSSTSTNIFRYEVTAGKQYRVKTDDAGVSYTNTWQNNLCDRLNITHKENGLTAWYFIEADNLDDSSELGLAILSAQALILNNKIGNNPGQISEEAKNLFQAVIDAAILVRDNENATESEIDAAIASINAAKDIFLESKNPIKVSTNDDVTWYYIVSAHTGYAKDKVLINQNNQAGTSILFGDKLLDPNRLWKFVDAGNGKLAIQNMASSLYISANPRNSGTSANPVGFNVIWLNVADQLLMKADGQDYLHAQQAGTILVTWGTSDAGSASAWRLEELSGEDATSPMEISSVSINQGIYTTTGIGNKDHGIAYLSINTAGLIGDVKLNSIRMDFLGTNNVNAIEKIKIYNTGSSNRLDATEHTLIGEFNRPTGPTNALNLEFSTPVALASGINNLYIAVDVSEDANEGDLLKTRVASVNYDSGTESGKLFDLPVKAIEHASIIYLKRSVVLQPGDYGSVSYRIPAIITADDGALVAITDKRKYNDVDLPQDIDILAQRSTDGGRTWSEPVTIALGTGYGKGFGDAALIKTNSGKLVALYVGGVGLWGATSTNPLRHYMSTSDDHGLTWTAPHDITPQLYGFESTHPIRKNWQSSFFGSGRGLTLRDGRIMAVIAVIEPGMGGLQNYAVYSDDEGETWNVSERAIVGGDEAKVVELNDGTVLMSSRQGGNRLWAKSSDRGETWGSKNTWSDIWGNACDADIIRYTSTIDGYDKNRLLHTLPNDNQRKNLTMWISYDEGTSWGTKKTLCPGTSAYSSITILPDGTIGVYFEEDGSKPYTMTFINFSLEWLTSGADNYVPATQNSVSTHKEDAKKIIVVDGRISIDGYEDDFRVFNISGVEMNSKSKLSSGVYLVNVGKHTYKVNVK